MKNYFFKLFIVEYSLNTLIYRYYIIRKFLNSIILRLPMYFLGLEFIIIQKLRILCDLDEKNLIDELLKVKCVQIKFTLNIDLWSIAEVSKLFMI